MLVKISTSNSLCKDLFGKVAINYLMLQLVIMPFFVVAKLLALVYIHGIRRIEMRACFLIHIHFLYCFTTLPYHGLS